MDYKQLYTLLFNASTDALEQIAEQNYGKARDILITAQRDAEEFISTQKTDPARRAKQCRAVHAPGRIIQKGGARPLPFGRWGCRGEIETPLPFSWGI